MSTAERRARRAIPDPRLAPIDASLAALPPVPAGRLRPDALRERFRHPPAWTPEVVDDRWRLDDTAPRAAAVLIALVVRGDALGVLLTERTAHLSAHAGQVAFPGGATERADATPVITALREAEEEIGLPRERVEVLGTMPAYLTGSGFVVTPVVGLVAELPELSPDPGEVDEVFEVPLAWLMDPARHQRRLYRWVDGAERSFFAMPWTCDRGREHFVWGVTAAIVRNLYRFLAA